MSFFEKWETAMGNKDLDALMELMHPERTMVMYSSRKVINRDDYKQTIGQVVVRGKLTRNDVRCIYENDDLMVEHAIGHFFDWFNRCSTGCCHTKRWKIISDRNWLYSS